MKLEWDSHEYNRKIPHKRSDGSIAYYIPDSCNLRIRRDVYSAIFPDPKKFNDLKHPPKEYYQKYTIYQFARHLENKEYIFMIMHKSRIIFVYAPYDSVRVITETTSLDGKHTYWRDWPEYVIESFNVRVVIPPFGVKASYISGRNYLNDLYDPKPKEEPEKEIEYDFETPIKDILESMNHLQQFGVRYLMREAYSAGYADGHKDIVDLIDKSKKYYHLVNGGRDRMTEKANSIAEFEIFPKEANNG